MKPEGYALLLLFCLTGCQFSQPGFSGETLSRSQADSPDLSGEYTPTLMSQFTVSIPSRGLTSPPQGLTSPPQGLTSPPQGLTSPPQGLTSPPQGFSPTFGIQSELERSHFVSFDADGDNHWNKAELGAYVRVRSALSQGFAAMSLNPALSLNIEGLMDTYDHNHDRRLDYQEARYLHAGLSMN